MTLVPFVAWTFGISLAGFACVWAIPAARSPEGLIGLPFWLIMVWGPSLAAMIISYQDGNLGALLTRAVRVEGIPPVVWLLVVAPIVLVYFMRPFAPEAAQPLGLGMLAGMVFLNLILGPLGEEMGWRGMMQEVLNHRIGWLEASLLIGLVWFVWHLPLWAIDSPHAQISVHLFGAHVMAYSIIIGAAYTMSGGSILPAILIHLTVNLAANVAVFAGFRDPDAWFSASLPYLWLIAIAAAVLVYLRVGQWGLRFLDP